MTTSQATAVWERTLRDGAGTYRAGSGAFSGAYSFRTRFEGAPGSTPEELIAAAHAACFSMALAADLEKAGTPSTRIESAATCTLDRVNGVPTITTMAFTVRGAVPGVDAAAFQRAAELTMQNCPVSRALKGNVTFTVEARLA
jgi:osmotically inducible protein OsmC